VDGITDPARATSRVLPPTSGGLERIDAQREESADIETRLGSSERTAGRQLCQLAGGPRVRMDKRGVGRSGGSRSLGNSNGLLGLRGGLAARRRGRGGQAGDEERFDGHRGGFGARSDRQRRRAGDVPFVSRRL
jgi:hypothetical protein